MQAHLEDVLGSFLVKKDRQLNKIEKYESQQKDMREKFIDQTTLENGMKDKEIHPDEIQRVVDRKTENQRIGINIGNWLARESKNLVDQTEEFQTHARELRKMTTEDKIFFDSPYFLKNAKEQEIEEANRKNKVITFDTEKGSKSFCESYLPINTGTWVVEKRITLEKKKVK